jgi:secreted PhoX family phosphatase
MVQLREMHTIDRRRFMAATGVAFAALAAAGCRARSSMVAAKGYGPLKVDPAGLLDLPESFSYRVLSSLGDTMDDGGAVPDAADGMGCFALPGGKLALVRNHELTPERDSGGARGLAYDTSPEGRILPGGTTTLVLDPVTLKVERQYRSLSGTIRNCSGGVTPWGSWLSCEEDVTTKGSSAIRAHGWIFEVPADASGPVAPVPLTAMGRFKHEAAAVDPVSGHVYLTEDRDDGLLYRFIPKVPGKLTEGGKLQALALTEPSLADSRNWTNSGFRLQRWYGLRWIDLDDPESPADDLRKRGAAAGALLFARGEGIHLGLNARGKSELFFVCTSGGAARLGQVFRLELSAGRERLQLFFESDDESQFNFGDNLTVAPDGQLVVCEDQYTATVDNHLRGLTRDGQPYPLARLRTQTELAGACFSPDGKVMFVNVYSPAKTLAISGPWAHLQR